jgi:Fic family protein
MREPKLILGPDLVKLIAEIDEFKGRWEAPDGQKIGIVFETATPFDTPREMEDLIAWTRKAIDEEALHPLLIVAVFIVVFLAIHPFQDGNGRLSRVLTTLLLLRAGYAYVPYASLERVI